MKVRTKRRTIQDTVDIDIKQARRAAINVIQDGGKIASLLHEYIFEGDSLIVEIAADVLEGNGDPFKNTARF